jgi:hypothetical protein
VPQRREHDRAFGAEVPIVRQLRELDE